jgi:hypothetical protein
MSRNWLIGSVTSRAQREVRGPEHRLRPPRNGLEVVDRILQPCGSLPFANHPFSTWSIQQSIRFSRTRATPLSTITGGTKAGASAPSGIQHYLY